MFDLSGNENKHILLNPNDIDYLELLDAEKVFCKPQFEKYNINSYESIIREVCRYSMINPIFAAKIFLNVDLMPFQGYLNNIFLDKNFVILVATRGFGKCTRDSYVITDNGFKIINSLFNENDDFNKQIEFDKEILGENGFHIPQYKWKTTKKAIKITTKTGESIIGSEVHPIRVLDEENNIVWKELKELKEKDYLIYDKNKNNEWYKNTNDIEQKEAYFIGKEIKELEDRILSFSQDSAKSFLQGLFDNNSRTIKIGDSLSIKCETKSKDMAKYIKFLLSRFGVVSCLINNLVYVYDTNCIDFCYNIGFKDKRRQGKLERAIKRIKRNNNNEYYYDKIEKIAYIGEQELYDFYFDEEDHSYITDGYISHNSFMLAVYSLLKAILYQGAKVVVVSASFRQSQVVFNYIDEIYKNSPFLRQICQGERPSRNTNMCFFNVGNSKIMCVPLGNGEKIRGLRGNCVDGDTLIKTTKGPLKIKDTFKYAYDESFKVYTGNGNNCFHPERFIETSLMNGYKIIFDNGIILKCSEIHRIYTKNGLKTIDKLFIGEKLDYYGEYPYYQNKIIKIKNIEKLPEKQIFYDYTIPEDHSFIGNSIKQHNCILIDEFASVPEDVFQVVVRGFSAVSLDPVSKVKEAYRKDKLKEKGVEIDNEEVASDNNQIILTGTASYEFNHFFRWKQKYEKIISCGNDRKKLKEIFGKEMSAKELNNLDPRKFAVVTVPYTAMPKKYMSDDMLSEARATMSKNSFGMEYLAKFARESDGFFPATLLIANSNYKPFFPKIKARAEKKYIMGVDPAKQEDHFAITIVEIGGNHNHKIVYCWATNEEKMKDSGEVNEHQTYYGACSRKIRMLMKQFPIDLIMMDAGGGGREIANYLQEKNLLGQGEQPIWDMDDPEQNLYKGLHIMKLISSNSNWVAEANHSLKKSLETRELTLPVYDNAGIEKELIKTGAIEKNILEKSAYMVDTIENVNEEMEELKKELMQIEVTATATGREHFDLVKQTVGQKAEKREKRRKDRYSSLVLAHYGIQFVELPEYNAYEDREFGGMASDISKTAENYTIKKQKYIGLPNDPNNFVDKVKVIRTPSGGMIVY